MKTELLKIAQDLEQGIITENEARTLLLGLLDVVDMLKAEHKRGLDDAAQALQEYEYRAGYYD